MAEAKWDFPELNGGNKQGYTNSGIETFKGTELIDNLAREICQNSLDAKDKDSDEPVIVKFQLQTVKKTDFKLFEEYAQCIERCKSFWVNIPDKNVESFIKRVDNVLAKDKIKILTVSDHNTTGLTGSDAAENEKSVWSALVSSDGVSAKNDNSAGGSYGIGKNAPFACSDISVVFYNTFAKDNKKAFEGVARAATLYNEHKKATHGTGHYRSNIEYKPITSEISCSFRDKFARDKYGTDIIIVGCEKLTEDSDWQDKLEQAVVKNFPLAVIENKLVVEIENKIINSNNLKSIIDRYRTTSSNASAQAIRLFDTIMEPDDEIKETIIESNDLEIRLKSDKNYKREIANFRTTGMLVGLNKRQMMQNFTAVVVVRGKKLDEILRSTEPPKHNKWDYKLIENKEEGKKAKQYIDEINQKVKKLIEENYKINLEDTVDADVGEYLPDELEDLANKNKKAGDDKLRSVQKVGKPKIVESPKDSNIETEKTTFGDLLVNNELSVSNRNKKFIPRPYPAPPGPNPTPYPYPEPVILPEVKPSHNGSNEGISKVEGTKTNTIYPSLKLQKIFAINHKQGLYKLIIKPLNNCEKLYVDFSATGEGETNDILNVEKYTINNQRFDCKGSKIGPIAINAVEGSEIFITFKNKEKMLINMEITEEVRK